ncbi:winged helix-turn-helix domain-containing protein [Leclercia adecarboxylata]|uniref:winged helix-turn-helix domain-containing protein n=1 Tax=Leclercia adecarboxylata TaxID=83655 RepID=UPI002029D49E|nr:winged helix-turn-helix domain-containing protein [Leclercia adecarboxylata]URN99640.1 winged helix-turn-helix domain-containing protein [Leclercia adecarboxylata]
MEFDFFIINDEIIFDVNSCQVKALDGPDEGIILNTPTARCLQLLIDKRGEVVSRESFLEQVWQVRGIVVSQNTFYQNISLLRKSLKKVGLTEDIIVTVRRKGFMLATDTRIQPIEDKNSLVGEGAEANITNDRQSSPLPNVAYKARGFNLMNAFLQSMGRESKMPKWFIVLIILFIILELISLISGYLNR